MKAFKKLLILAVAGIIFVSQLSAAKEVKAEENLERYLIPYPVSYEVKEGKFTLTANTKIYVSGEPIAELKNTAEYVAKIFRKSTGFAVEVVEGTAPAGNIQFTTVGGNAALGEEGYSIAVASNGVVVKSSSAHGIWNGAMTLRQLLPAEIESASKVSGVAWDMPACDIIDYPRYDYRGMHYDVARHFRTVEEAKRFIDNISAYKLNVIHFHLADDQGWRIEIKGSYTNPDNEYSDEPYEESYDKLRTIGACTSMTPGSGGMYSQEEFKDIIAYAAERYIEVVPEIDMPGHTSAALAALDFLTEPGTEKYHLMPTENGNVNVSSFLIRYKQGEKQGEVYEPTFTFVEEVIKQLSEICPSQYMHIGGDEPPTNTSHHDYEPHENLEYFWTRTAKICEKYGKTAIGWQNFDTAAEVSDHVVQYWNNNYTDKIDDPNMKVLMSPSNCAYLDMKYDSSYPYGQTWAAIIPVKNAYDWDPADSFANIADDKVIGVEGCLWSETFTTEAIVENMAFPRALCIAEVGWSPKEAKDWNRFLPYLRDHGTRMELRNINYYKDGRIWPEPFEGFDANFDFEEGEGKVAHDYTYDHTATLGNSIQFVEEGHDGKAIRSYRNQGGTIGISYAEGDWTIAGWFKPTTNITGNTTLFTGADTTIYWRTSGSANVSITGGTAGSKSFEYALPAGTDAPWVHVAFVGTANETKLYVNGELVGTVDAGYEYPLKAFGTTTGQRNQYIYIDTLRYRSRALSPEEILDLYNGAVDKAGLQNFVDTVKEFKGSDVIDQDALQELIEAVEEVINNESATQAEVDAALMAAKAQFAELVAPIPAQEAENEQGDFPDEAWDNYQEAIEELAEVVEDETAGFPEQVAALRNLIKAKKALREVPATGDINLVMLVASLIASGCGYVAIRRRKED